MSNLWEDQLNDPRTSVSEKQVARIMLSDTESYSIDRVFIDENGKQKKVLLILEPKSEISNKYNGTNLGRVWGTQALGYAWGTSAYKIGGVVFDTVEEAAQDLLAYAEDKYLSNNDCEEVFKIIWVTEESEKGLEE